jgi:hypothetical protein
VHGEWERLGGWQARGESAVDQQAPDVLERHPADQILDVHPAVAERRTFLVRLSDLGVERNHTLETVLNVDLWI